MDERTRKPLVGIDEVCRILGQKRQGVYELCRQKLIPHVRLGRKIRFDMDKVNEWIDNGGQGFPGGWKQDA